MASPLTVAHRRNVRNLRRIRKAKKQETLEQRLERERRICDRMTARHWHKRSAAALDVEYIPELPPTEFADYRYWLARKAGWERLAPLCHWPRIVVNESEWQWWMDQTRSVQLYIARLGISRIISGEV